MGSEYLDTTPMRPPPPGQTSDFVNPESRSYQLVIVIAVLIPLVTLFTTLRIYTRLRITRTFGLDDWICILATICTLSYSALILKLCFKPGGGILGIHLWDVPLSHYLFYQKASLADSVLIRICSALIKAAFMIFYLRLFRPVAHIRIMVWGGLVAVVLFTIAFVVIDLVACSPWPDERGGWLDHGLLDRCNKISPKLVTAAVYFSVITDFYILFIPLSQVHKMKISRTKKAGLSLIFLTGLFACGAALTNAIIRSDPRIFAIADFTWTIIPVYITSIIEINVGLICLSMPVVFALFIGRVTNLGKSLSSWIKAQRERRRDSGESSSNLSPGSSDTAAPVLPPIPNSSSTLTGVQRFIRNKRLSVTQNSTRAPETLASFNDLASIDMNYHSHLQSMSPGHQTVVVKGEKTLNNVPNTRTTSSVV